MDAVQEFADPEDGYPLIPYPSSTVYVSSGDSNAYECNPISIHIGRSFKVVTFHEIYSSFLCCKMQSIAPQNKMSAVIRNSKDPNNICIESMTFNFINHVHTETPDTLLAVTMITSTSTPKTITEIKDSITGGSGYVYKIPRLALTKLTEKPLAGISFSAEITSDEKIGRFLTIDEVSRAIARSTYADMCTGYIYVNQAQIAPLTLIPEPHMQIPVEFCIGLDNARLFDEYSKLRLPNTNREIPSDFTAVPLFRRVKSSNKHELYAPTLFGFWLRYFMDVDNNRRAHILPKKTHEYTRIIDKCFMVPIDETQSLIAMTIAAPRSLIMELYDGLLADIADDATARLYHAQKTNLFVLLSGSAMTEYEKKDAKPKQRMIAEITTVYRPITVTNIATRTQISFDANTDVVQLDDALPDEW